MWTDEQVKSLNDYQNAGYFHPYTCPAKSGEKHDLVATKDGWICPACSGNEILQTWAQDFMLNGEWRKSVPEQEKIYADSRVQKLLRDIHEQLD